jgi:hypothetical protein
MSCVICFYRLRIGTAPPERPPCARRIGALEKTIRESAEHPSENVILPARCPTSTATAAAICAPGKAMPLTEIVSMALVGTPTRHHARRPDHHPHAVLACLSTRCVLLCAAIRLSVVHRRQRMHAPGMRA